VDLTVAEVVVAVTVIVFGSVVQGTIGFGLGLLAAPFIAIVIPDAIPVTLVLVAWPIGGVAALREHHALDRKALPWMLAGALPGTVVGLVIIHLASQDALAVLVGFTTIFGVLATIVTPPLAINPVSATSAGFIGNVTGTAASVGGPPVALLFQHHRGPTVRATLGAYFAISATLSVVGYGVTGAITLDRFLLAVALLPAMLLGAWASKHFHGLVDKGWLRPSVLVLSSIAGAIAVIRGLA
jgi:uncharacterized membrane protein YfcA